MKAEQRYRLNALADKLVTRERFSPASPERAWMRLSFLLRDFIEGR